jgi:hypothetical protein
MEMEKYAENLAHRIDNEVIFMAKTMGKKPTDFKVEHYTPTIKYEGNILKVTARYEIKLKSF